MIDYDAIPNPGPVEAEDMDPIELQTILFRRNYGMRHDRDPYWQRQHRHFARQAITELRFLTNRQFKGWRTAPTHYGQQPRTGPSRVDDNSEGTDNVGGMERSDAAW